MNEIPNNLPFVYPQVKTLRAPKPLRLHTILSPLKTMYNITPASWKKFSGFSLQVLLILRLQECLTSTKVLSF